MNIKGFYIQLKNITHIRYHLKILFKITTRSRRSNFLRAYDSIINNISDKDNYHLLISLDEDDDCMFPLPELKGNHTFVVGNSINKVHAINRDVNTFDYNWDILVNVSDDQVFIVKGFDTIIRANFCVGEPRQECNARLSQVLHFPDQHQGANCMTMSIIGYDYYIKDMHIYNPEFESLWVDIVAQEQAQIRGCYKYVDKQIFVHLHPSFGDCAYDEQYRKTEDWGVRQRDYATYLRLKANYDKLNQFPIRSI